MTKLLIAIRVGAAFERLAIGLQAVAQFVQEFSDPRAAKRMLLGGQSVGQDANALTHPAQRRFRIAPAVRFDRLLDLGILHCELLASPARVSD